MRVSRIISSSTSTGRPPDAIVCHSAAASRAASAITPASAAMPLAMKGRLRDAPLAQPEFVLARQQAVAERHPQFVVERALVIVARVVLQDVANVRGVRDEVAASRADLEIDDVAELAGGAQEHAGRIASDRRQHAEDRKPARARWKRMCRASGVSHPSTGLYRYR